MKNYYQDKFIVMGKEGKSYTFFLRDMLHSHPGVFLLADNFEDYTPNIVYLENSDNVLESVEKLRSNPTIAYHINDCLLGVSLEQLPIRREELFNGIWSGLSHIPKINELLSKIS